MRLLLRHLFAVLVLPCTVMGVVPLCIARSYGLAACVAASPAARVLQAGGLLVMAAGLSLAAACVRRFASDGRGTLAPWDPPSRFVVQGPYQYVRNPMIAGVIGVLFGEACVLRAAPLLVWTLAFTALNAVYIPLVEEPQLARRFGGAYETYRRHVRRFVPRLTAWRGEP